MRFTDRVVVVTGAAQGIGAAIAKRLYDEGATYVALLDLNQQKLEEAALGIDPTGARAGAYACNVSKPESVQTIFSAIEQAHGRIDILVNNAGITRDAMLHKMTDEQWLSVIDINLNSMYYCCKAAFGNMGQTNYGASKGGVIGFTKCLAKEAARSGITVNCIAPSYINTDMLRAIPEAVMQKFLGAIPMERLGEPEELAAAAAFLCSDDSSFVTGECLVVSGGSYM